MAIFSSHLLDATNGSHAGNIDVIIYQIKKNGDKEIFFESIYSKSFFENEKLILISDVTDKTLNIIEEVIETKIEEALNAGVELLRLTQVIK